MYERAIDSLFIYINYFIFKKIGVDIINIYDNNAKAGEIFNGILNVFITIKKNNAKK